MLTEFPQNFPKFFCVYCDIKTNNKKDFHNHLLTPKHQKREFVNKSLTQISPNHENIEHSNVCINCGKKYASRAGIWKHKQKGCIDGLQECHANTVQPIDKDLILLLIKENSDIKNMMMEVIKNGTHNTTNNTNTNSNNKAFNLQFFLNETCKDAMNIMDFVDTIQLQLADLERVGQLGYVEGISNIITTNLKKLDVTQRPVHCTDRKRETIYIRDDNTWTKDETKTKLKKVIKHVVHKNQRLIPKFKEAHPDCIHSSSKYSDQYNKLIIEAMGGRGDNDYEKEERIIQKIAKEVTVDKPAPL